MGIYRQRASHSEGIGRSHRDWIYLEIFLIFAYCLRSPVCSKKFAFEADVTFPTTGQKIIEWAFVEILHFKIMTYPRINALNISSDRALRRRIVRLRSLLCDTKWEVFCEGLMFISNRWCKVKSIVFVDASVTFAPQHILFHFPLFASSMASKLRHEISSFVNCSFAKSGWTLMVYSLF